MSTPPFTLPDEPIDRYELRWFSFYENCARVRIDEFTARYYVSASFEEVTGDAVAGAARFENEWRVGTEASWGRAEGWRPTLWFGGGMRWDREFATRSEAVVAARRWLVDRLGALSKKTSSIVKQLNEDAELRP